MAWVKLDDRFWMHPKVMIAGNDGAGLFCKLLSYCGAYGTDGKIPSRAVSLMADGDQDLIDKIERAGLVITHGGLVEIPDYLDYNPSKAQVDADRAAAKERQDRLRGGRRNGHRKASQP